MALAFYNSVVRFKTHFVGSRLQRVSKFASDVSKPDSNDSGRGLLKLTSLTGMQKWALVFSGKYKSKDEIPKQISIDVLERARSKTRIKLSNYLMAMTMLGCLGYAYTGRKAASRGESISKMNMDWHKDYNEQLAKEKASQKT